MAKNDKAKLRYDDFVGNVQSDPAKPVSTIMLSGFVGHGPEGHARVYPDPTLGNWYDIPEADIIHSMPIADSKLGGSYVWVHASAQIKPGNAAPPATEAVQPQAAAAGMQPTPATHCFVCDAPMAAAAAVQPTPTPATLCLICPPHVTLPNVFTKWPVCPIGPLGGPTFLTLEPVCATLFTCPPTLPPGCPPRTQDCHQGAQMAALTIGTPWGTVDPVACPTMWACTQPNFCR